MRHRKAGRKLGRTSAHRKAMLRNLVCSLFLTAARDDDKPRRVTTTVPKAKEARRFAERCITLGKKALAEHDGEDGPSAWQSPHVRRLRALLGRRDAIRCLLEDVAPLYNDRQGGYTRILRLTTRRLGDGADLCYLELVTEPVEERKAAAPAEPVAPRRSAKPAAEAPAEEEQKPETGAPAADPEPEADEADEDEEAKKDD